MCLHADTKNATVLESDIYLAPTTGWSFDDDVHVAVGFVAYDEVEGDFRPSASQSRILSLDQVAELRDNLTRILNENNREAEAPAPSPSATAVI